MSSVDSVDIMEFGSWLANTGPNLRSDILLIAACVAFSVSGCGGSGDSSQAIQIDGSSTVFPISEAFAEEFQITTGNRVVVGLSGTGGGFKKFCRGETSFSGASRPIKASEAQECRVNGVSFVELPIAMDALANVVHLENHWATCMTVAELKKIWEPEAQGRINNWKQVRDGFPDRTITLFGAGTDSGTYDYFTLAIVGMESTSRGDFTATEDDNITVQGVSTDLDALGFLGVAYLEENRSRLKAVAIKQPNGNCVEPNSDNAASGTYQPLTRPLFMYVNAEHLDTRDNVEAFAMYLMTSETAPKLVSATGYLALPPRAFDLGQAKIRERKTGSFFADGSLVGVTVEELLAAN